MLDSGRRQSRWLEAATVSYRVKPRLITGQRQMAFYLTGTKRVYQLRLFLIAGEINVSGAEKTRMNIQQVEKCGAAIAHDHFRYFYCLLLIVKIYHSKLG